MRTSLLLLALCLASPRYASADEVEPASTASVALPAVEDASLQLASYLTPKKGGFRVKPYGTFSSSMIYATERTRPGEITLFVPSAEEQGESAFTFDTRSSRFGLDVVGPPILAGEEFKSHASLEIDFRGDFVNENRAGVQLRHAFWEAHNERQRILVGQTWDVASPLWPRTVDYSVGYFAGNLGFRRAQFRYEHYFAPSEQSRLILQGSLNQDIVVDFASDSSIRRESASWPVVEARAAIALNPDKGRDATTLGISGHVGETGFDFLTAGPPPLSLPAQDDARFETWSYNIDLAMPVGERFHLQAEFFQGANLSPLLGGVGQGVCPCLRVPIRSIGGWVDVEFVWSAHVRSHVGYGIDDPNDDDLLFGRISNQFLFANLISDITEKLSTGIEVSYRETRFQETRAGLVPADTLGPTEPGESFLVNVTAKYSF